MTTVCHITTVHGDHDDRIFFKMARSSAAAGNSTFQVAPGIVDAEEDGVELRSFRAPVARPLRATAGAWRAYRTARRTGARVMHLHDPELLWVGLCLKWKGHKVVFDMHEMVASQIIDKTWLGPMWLRRVMAWVYLLAERFAIKRFDAIVLAETRYTDEMLPRYPQWTGKFHVIRNLPVLGIIDRSAVQLGRHTAFTMIYIGGLSRIRGIKEVIQAMSQCQGVRLKLLGPWAEPAYRAECTALSAWDRVEDIGQIRMDEVYDHVRAADLGICLLYPVHNYMISLPIKTFEYMACGLPMLLSDFHYWQQTFGPYSWFANAQDPDTIAEAIRAAHDQVEQRARKGRLGREEVLANYNWESESSRLVDLYRELSA